jgi:hypothetical protein
MASGGKTKLFSPSLFLVKRISGKFPNQLINSKRTFFLSYIIHGLTGLMKVLTTRQV